MSPLLLLLLGLVSLLLGLTRWRKRRPGEPPLITGWIPYIGKALEFGRDAKTFLEDLKRKHGDVFTVHMAGKYMTFIMDPLLFPSIIKHGRQLDFHEFTNKVASATFGYPPTNNAVKFPGLQEKISRTFQLLQGENLTRLTESMMGNLMLLFRQDHLGEGAGQVNTWKSSKMYDFCNKVMFEASLLTMYGRPLTTRRHSGAGVLRDQFVQFDSMFPLLIAQIPIALLRGTKAVRQKLIEYFLPQRMALWSQTSQFIRTRSEVLTQYDTLGDIDRAAHHFAILWAAVGNTVPACFWSTYHLVSHPEAMAKVRQEILDVLERDGVEFNPDRDVRLSKEQLDKLLFLDSAISESLRLSSASMNIRLAQEDFSLRLAADRSVPVRKGDFIALYPQSMHMDPEIYEEPQTFRLDRYIENGQEKTDFFKDGQKLKYYLMPFGSGSTKCPGRFFAINEIKQFLCLLLLYFDLRLEEGQHRAMLGGERAGLGILPPAEDVSFQYRLRQV